MKYDRNKHHRRSIRLKGYDYSQPGAYFVTICTYERQCLFGKIVNGQMRLNGFGEIVAEQWQKSAVIRQEIKLDAWVVMPKHVHGIVVITNPVGANGGSPLRNNLPQHNRLSPCDRSIRHNHEPLRMKPKSLSSSIAGFKSTVTKQINILRDAPGTPVWQRNYYEHIIRDRSALNKIRQYVINNPLAWQTDQLHLDNTTKW
ncbi:transposase [Myxosarcina sp. GI1]|uniref:transposase n=1 Tax=Myxosarcina sp. GI1 TaxID=1541065 RepID=UPI00055BD099|nr:transposase [Myxosarcina sp. GI1]